MVATRIAQRGRSRWLWAALPVIGWLSLVDAAEQGVGFTERFEREGIVVDATVSPAESASVGVGPLRSGAAVAVRFKLSDQIGKPLTGAFPTGWMVLQERGATSGDPEIRCRLNLRRLEISSLPYQSEVDLNAYLVLALNEDATISVIDPLNGFGGSRLLGLVPLDGVGEDWIQLPDQDRVAVTIPGADAVDIVDARSWDASVRRLAVGGKPRRLALQPDRGYFWVDAIDAATGAAIAVAVNTGTLAVAGRIPIGQGPHDFAFTADSRFLFVANLRSGTVSIIDVGALASATELPTGPRPVSLAYSDLSNAIYVADAQDGSVTVLDARSHAVRTRIAGTPGIAQIRFAPGGRFAFSVNKSTGSVAVIDSSVDGVVQTFDAPGAPDQVAFTGTLAYVRQSKSATVLMVPLDKISAAGGKLPTLKFPGGIAAPVATDLPSAAPGIVPAAGDRAVLVGNAGDREIYYYQEGLAAPVGSFTNYKRQPRALMVLRRDLREREPGIYETTAVLGRPGSYDLVFRLDQPPLHHCFSFEVATTTTVETRQPHIAPLAPVGSVQAGRPVRLGFVVTDTTTGRPVADLTDLTVLVMTPAWQARKIATPAGDGHYNVDFTVPVPGFYAVMARSADVGMDYQPMPGLSVTVAP
jgi:YVTN family beta-propeller protein